MRFKQFFFRVVFLAEITLFCWGYFWGEHGVAQIDVLVIENNSEEQKVELLKEEVSVLEDKIDQWGKNSFYREQIAREKLQMKYPNEQVYLIQN
ncbi:septum formation initiator family protein [bacterium]|jgi:cell division protein FtsB|nr:septum formation initiator family protein [bacterium]